ICERNHEIKKIAGVLSLALMSSTVFATDVLDSQYVSTPNKTYNSIDKPPQIKVANYNIAGGLRNHKVDLDKVADAIKKLNPDIIALEEVDQKTIRSNRVVLNGRPSMIIYRLWQS
ncbi:TPA: hypothetical protein ACIBGC_003980, partial [Salmonella enterica subsp. enterica serovar Eastbourne]